MNNDISHLDVVSPFEVLDACDVAIAKARKAFADHVARTPMVDAVKDDAEAYFVQALDHFWTAREALCASLEAE